MKEDFNLDNILFKTENLSFNNMIFYKDIIIEKDKVTFIVGDSGTGKTTLLKMLNGIKSLSAGKIFFGSNDLNAINTITLRKEVSLISQEVYLFDTTIIDNFKMFYDYRNLPCINNDEITAMLALCCIPLPLESECAILSAGERQRVYIALFLSFLPKVIMLDEPTSALDCNCSHNLLENIISFCKQKNISVIIVSHNKELTEKYAEETIQLNVDRGAL